MLGKRKAVGMVPPSKKKRKAASTVEEIKFDFNAREDYLTGFHKRKLQRTKHAKEEAAKREREAKIEARKILREERKVNLEKHVEEVNALLRRPSDGTASDTESAEDEGEQWDGVAEPPSHTQEAEYADDDRFITVTVEAVDISRDGFHKAGGDVEGEINDQDVVEGPKSGQSEDREKGSSSKRTWTKERPGGPKKKKKKFRYESKAERKVTRYKENTRSRKQARARKS